MRFLTASKVFDGKQYFKENTVLIINEKGIIADIVSESQVDRDKLEKMEGILCPGFINAHCHLELSHLHNLIPAKTGIVDFALNIIKQRNILSEEKQLEAMKASDAYMWENGIVAVGDISNTGLSSAIKKNALINYHTFVELIGLNPIRKEVIMEAGIEVVKQFQQLNLAVSMASHAPYSVSLELMGLINEFNATSNSISTIHNQESEQENLFLSGEKSDFQRLYDTLGIDVSWFKPRFESSLRYYYSILKIQQKQLLVHNTVTNINDINLAKDTHTLFCFCPLANLYIENKLPNFSLFDADNFCVGTDSLASNKQLNLMDEVNCILQHSNYSVEQCLRAITNTGASFLQLNSTLGSFEIGKKPSVNLITEENRKLSFSGKIV
jgi:aminodeoxyfutalosine deaminase